MLPVTFSSTADYDKIEPTDRISMPKLHEELRPGNPLTLVIKKQDGKEMSIKVNQTFNENQITWFKVGLAFSSYCHDR